MKTLKRQKIYNFLAPGKNNNYEPHILKRGILLYFAIFLFILNLIILFFSFQVKNRHLFAEISKNVLINLTNETRIKYGVGELTENEKLNKAAALKARDILNNDYFSHWSPSGVTPWHWFQVAKYDYLIAGENLGIGFSESQSIYNAWLNSPLHKANIISDKYKEMGIAVARGEYEGKEVSLVVQLFGYPKAATEILSKNNKAQNENFIVNTTEKNKEGGKEEETKQINEEKNKTTGEKESFPPSTSGSSQNLTNKNSAEKYPEAVLGKQTFFSSVPDVNLIKENPEFRFYKFIILNFSKIIKWLTVYSFVFTLLLFAANVYWTRNKYIIIKNLGLPVILLLTIAINFSLTLKILSPSLKIY